MNRRMLAPKALAVGAAASLALAACSGDSGLTVGSKDFTEQVILGKMMVIALQDAGFEVTDQTNLAGTPVVRSALEEGEIDLYWEYTGTAWVDIFGNEEIVEDPDELLSRVAEHDRQENDIIWGDIGDFENTYALASNQEVLEELGVVSLSDLGLLSQSDPEAASICSNEEFAGREDGWLGVKETYNIEVPDEDLAIMDPGIIYNEISEGGNCNFGMVFTTDGRIDSLDLYVLEDDQNFFPEYNPAMTIRREVHEETPEVRQIANEIISRIDFQTMRELNLRADGESVPHEQVARQWLEEEDFTSWMEEQGLIQDSNDGGS